LHSAQDNDMQNGNHTGQGQHRKQKRLDHRERLRDQEEPVSVRPVNDDAGERRKQEHRELADESGDAEHEGRAGEAVDQPAGSHAGDPRADDGDPLAAVVEAVVPGTERADDIPRFGHEYRYGNIGRVTTEARACFSCSILEG
jgi:hypothetical protein